MIDCATFCIGDSYYLSAQILPGCGKKTGAALYILQRLQMTPSTKNELIFSTPGSVGGTITPARKRQLASIRSLIICATRESCYATSKVCRDLGKYLSLYCVDIVGGEDRYLLLKKAKEGIDIGVCTVGKLWDLVSHCPELLNKVEIICFDDTEITLETKGTKDVIELCTLFVVIVRHHGINICVCFLL